MRLPSSAHFPLSPGCLRCKMNRATASWSCREGQGLTGTLTLAESTVLSPSGWGRAAALLDPGLALLTRGVAGWLNASPQHTASLFSWILSLPPHCRPPWAHTMHYTCSPSKKRPLGLSQARVVAIAFGHGQLNPGGTTITLTLASSQDLSPVPWEYLLPGRRQRKVFPERLERGRHVA